ncbi:hypothetical protein BDV23DRAFT_155097, partial [Aspergillus alliaceus]
MRLLYLSPYHRFLYYTLLSHPFLSSPLSLSLPPSASPASFPLYHRFNSFLFLIRDSVCLPFAFWSLFPCSLINPGPPSQPPISTVHQFCNNNISGRYLAATLYYYIYILSGHCHCYCYYYHYYQPPSYWTSLWILDLVLSLWAVQHILNVATTTGVYLLQLSAKEKKN